MPPPIAWDCSGTSGGIRCPAAASPTAAAVTAAANAADPGRQDKFAFAHPRWQANNNGAIVDVGRAPALNGSLLHAARRRLDDRLAKDGTGCGYTRRQRQSTGSHRQLSSPSALPRHRLLPPLLLHLLPRARCWPHSRSGG